MIPFGLLSPVSGTPLRADTPHSLREGKGGRRWPVVDGIPYLRVGRDDLVAEVLDHLDSGEADAALARLLADQDEWWTEPAPPQADLLALVCATRDTVTLRDAVQRLGWGRVGDYFLHRWSDPTYLAGLALLEAHWNRPLCAFEFACGIGHYLRELHGRGVKVAGADVVFAKLWVARHWVVGAEAQLVCFDAASPHWPVAASPVDVVLCTTPSTSCPTRPASSTACADAPARRLARDQPHPQQATAPASPPAAPSRPPRSRNCFPTGWSTTTPS